MRVLVPGSGGMVGRAVVDHCNSVGDVVLPYNHQSLNIGDFASVMSTLRAERPDAVINCAAATNVDACELEPELAFQTNALGPENLAKACREVAAVFVTISTDYVFDGTKGDFYTEEDQPNPQSVYAKSKLKGEQLALDAYARTIVVRSGFIFGPGGNNFLSTILARARQGQKIAAIDDAYGTPTYSRDLAGRLRDLSVRDQPGIYHVMNRGEGVSFMDFARRAIEIAGCDEAELLAISMDSLKRSAARPRDSRLRSVHSESLGLAPLREWSVALQEFASQS